VTGLILAAVVLLLALIGCHVGIAVFEGRFKRPEKPAEQPEAEGESRNEDELGSGNSQPAEEDKQC
jgi:hypothetical protein